jgi:hypothetical protein
MFLSVLLQWITGSDFFLLPATTAAFGGDVTLPKDTTRTCWLCLKMFFNPFIEE